jgi:hypothetical protein
MAAPANPEQIAAFIKQQLREQIAVHIATALAEAMPAAPAAAAVEPSPAHKHKAYYASKFLRQID